MSFLDTLEGHTKTIQLSLIEKEIQSLKDAIEKEVAGDILDNLLYLLLNAMGLLFLVDKNYRKNIKDFTGSFVICSEDNMIDVSAIFKKISVPFAKQDGMEVKKTIIDNPTSMVKFKDGKSMVDFLLTGNPDIIAGMLNNQLTVYGNLNYLFKFVYLLMLIPEILGINDFKKLLNQH
ncbi:MAG: hypothetical protein OEM02_14045 [Desulfobulbaceae bacterium]|nr:hypothetical protein [Desulfobulbaceae bacterium]